MKVWDLIFLLVIIEIFVGVLVIFCLKFVVVIIKCFIFCLGLVLLVKVEKCVVMVSVSKFGFIDFIVGF